MVRGAWQSDAMKAVAPQDEAESRDMAKARESGGSG